MINFVYVLLAFSFASFLYRKLAFFIKIQGHRKLQIGFFVINITEFHKNTRLLAFNLDHAYVIRSSLMTPLMQYE